MSDGEPLQGHVDGLSRGSTGREKPNGADLLAYVNPTFEWVRLAQRIECAFISIACRPAADQLRYDLYRHRYRCGPSVGDPTIDKPGAGC